MCPGWGSPLWFRWKMGKDSRLSPFPVAFLHSPLFSGTVKNTLTAFFFLTIFLKNGCYSLFDVRSPRVSETNKSNRCLLPESRGQISRWNDKHRGSDRAWSQEASRGRIRGNGRQLRRLLQRRWHRDARSAESSSQIQSLQSNHFLCSHYYCLRCYLYCV